MKIEINDKIINACKLNRPVLDLLCPKRSGRYTKLEAYIDLLDRIASQKNDDVHTGEVVSVVPGEFAVTITELSEKWNWHRATVRSFLDSLEEIGEITGMNGEEVAIQTLYRRNVEGKLEKVGELAHAEKINEYRRLRERN